MNVDYWNGIIYRNDDGKWAEGERLTPDKLWDEFGIKSGPKFQDACWSDVPVKWTEDVRLFLAQVRKELGDRIEFGQIKEKWCELTVYFTASDKEAGDRLLELKRECVDRLIAKGIHPGNKGDEDE